VAIEREVRHSPKRADDERAYGDVGNEMTVHHVAVNESRAAALGCANLFAQFRKIG
jgi:hypothetical protein